VLNYVGVLPFGLNGGERVPHRHKTTSKSLQPLLALVSYETDEEQTCFTDVLLL